MVHPDVVAYLRVNLDLFTPETLKEQLFSEGISEEDFSECLAAAIRSRKVLKRRRFLGIFLMVAGGGVFLLSAASLLVRYFTGSQSKAADYATGSLIGHYGFVVAIPEGYMAYDRQPAVENDIEKVFFFKNGTRPDNLLDEGLYGGLGIVRMEVSPGREPWGLNAAAVARAVEERSQRRKETYRLNDLHFGALSGVEFVFGAPSPRSEAYVFGSELSYSLFGGQDDTLLRQILSSLRDKNSEE
jgi:hypothetical protein